MTLKVYLNNSYGDMEILRNVISIHNFYEVKENILFKYIRITFVNNEIMFYDQRYSLYSVVTEE